MNRDQSYTLIRQTFTQGFDKARFQNFAVNLLNRIDESKAKAWNTTYVKDAFKNHVSRYERLGTYTSPDNEKLDVLIVHLTDETKLARARTAIRNFVAHHLKTRDEKDAALVAFVSPTEKQWRFSYVKMEYATVEKESGKVGVETRLTPARRFSYIVGEGESCHTAQTRFLSLLQDTKTDPKLADIEEAFSVEAVTKEFFKRYVGLFGNIHEALEKIIKKDTSLCDEFQSKNVNTVDFAKKLMGQIVFLYFLQKKGWLGVEKGKDWGTGPHDFLRRLAGGEYGAYANYFNDVLEPLFYDTLATDRGHEAWCRHFKCRIPFLNGGLFEPLGGYNWSKTEILLPNRLFTNNDPVEEGITGTGVLDVFDRYNFTVNEAEPLEKEVAIDPEMLGKVFENLIEENRRKGLGAYYTPREIVHYMCRESLINYLDSALNMGEEPVVSVEPRQNEMFGEPKPEQMMLTAAARRVLVPRKDIVALIQLGDQASHYEAARMFGTKSYKAELPKSIEKHARLIDDKLQGITVCDPAVGSGAFPVGMMTEIVRARSSLTPYFNDVHERTPYFFKRHAIQNCLYGVDIDPGAVEIAKLRLWLSLVVDEEDVKQVRPLPNLDYKVMTGNSLIGFPFKSQRLDLIEKVKKQFFDETDHEKKAKLKSQIDQQLYEAFAASKKSLGYNVDFDFLIFFSEVFHEKAGFDVIIANPPYVGQKGNKELFQEIARTELGRQFHQRRMDLFYFFIHLALNLAHSRTQIAFITTNYYITATYADKLRKDLFQRATFRSLINFNELRIFESAQGQHNMISLLERGKYDEVEVLTAMTKRIGFATPSVLNAILSVSDACTVYRKITQSQLYQGEQLYISIAGNHSSTSDPKMAILSKVANNSDLLGSLCGIFTGIQTGADKVSPQHILRFHLKASVGDGIFVLSNSELDALELTEKERRFIRPWFKNSDIGRYTYSRESDYHLIYRSSKHAEGDIPNIKKHLSQFKVVLVNRNVRAGEVTISQYDEFVRGNGHIDYVMIASAMKAGNYYCISYAREEGLFNGPKIVSPQRSYRNTFCYNDVPWYASADVYYITAKDTSIDLKYILALLNSNLYFLWFYLKGKRKGEMLELYGKPLSEIPIRHIQKSDQKPFIELVDCILTEKKHDPASDTSVWESEINRLVYELYGLTEDEIAIVEGKAS